MGDYIIAYLCRQIAIGLFIAFTLGLFVALLGIKGCATKTEPYKVIYLQKDGQFKEGVR